MSVTASPHGSLPPLVEPGPPLTVDERARFARHLLLDRIGDQGQRRLRNAAVLVVGAGGLGSPILLYLAAAGVGRITVVDDDEVDLGNLQRQVIHSRSSIGQPKVESARDRIGELTEAVQVDAVPVRVDETNILGLIGGAGGSAPHDLVIDGSDNFATRYLVADACEITGVPLVWGTIDRFRGQLSVFWSRPPAGVEAIGLRDLYPNIPPPGSVPSCAEAGVLGALCGSVGSMMAIETVKLICGIGRPLLGRLLLVDALDMSTRSVRLRPDPERAPVTELAAPLEVECELATIAGPAVPEVSVAAVASMLASEAPPLLLDVRTAGERTIAAIEPSVWIPLDRLAEDAADPTGLLGRALAQVASGSSLVVYCKAGARSARAVALLEDMGVSGAISMAGGIDAWAREIEPGMPTY